MAGWRVGVAIKPEKEYGVEDTSGTWHYIGEAMDFNLKENNNYKYVNGIGSKGPVLQFEGRFSGSFGGSLYLDYNNIYWLLFLFEKYTHTTTTIGSTTCHVHTFEHANNKATRTCSILIQKLNKDVGGPFDENIILTGCVFNNLNPGWDSQSAGVKTSFGGIFADTILTAVSLDDIECWASTTKKTVKALNWGCLLIKDDSTWTKVANNERTGFTLSRSISTYPDCGQRKDVGFSETARQPISVTALCYSKNPNQWQTRVHTGGKVNDIAVGGTSTPRKKGLEPIPDVCIASTSDTEDTSESGGDSAKYKCRVYFKDVAVESWGPTYNAGSEITESPTMRAMSVKMVFTTPDTDALLVPAVVTYQPGTGATGTAVTQNVIAGEDFYLLSNPGFTKEGKTFEGWSVVIGSATAVNKDAGAKVSLTTADTVITATARWSA